jgi:hypothetical protein
MTYHGYARLGVGVMGSFYPAYFFLRSAENTVCFTFLTRCRTLSRAMRDLTMSLGKYQEHHLRPRVGGRLDPPKNDKVETAATEVLSINNRMALIANCTTAASELS